MAYTFNPFTSKLDYYIDPIYLPLAGGTMTGNIVMPAESYIGPTSTTGIYLKSGNVGIGTTGPTHALTFPSGSTGIALYNTADQTTNYERLSIAQSSNVWKILTEKSGSGTLRNIQIGDPSTAFLYLDVANSAIGFGTAYPTAKLEVAHNAGTSAPSDIMVVTALSPGTPIAGFGPRLVFRTESDDSSTRNNIAGISGILQTATTGAVDGALAFYTMAGSAAMTEKMIIDKSGKVGIGITNPFAKVTIPSGTGYNGMYAIEVAAHASSRRWWLHTDYIAYGDFSISTETSKQQGANPNLSRLYLNPSGNVGIGTTGPAVKLDIAGSMQVSSAVALSLGGYVRTFAEATGTPSGTTTYFDIAVNVPTGCKLLGAQLRVDTALTAGETWSAAYVTGSTTTLAAAGTAVAKNTKVNKMHVDEITSATTKVRITRDAGNFTDAAGVIRAIVYYETFTNLGTAA